jgi:hypothetical protein
MTAKDTEVKAGCNTIQAALEQHAVDNAGSYPGLHWQQDSGGEFYVGPGVLGGVPTIDPDGEPRTDFYVAKDASDPRQPFLVDGTPNVNALDKLVVDNYITDYPSNPFMRGSSGVKAQMSNLFFMSADLNAGSDPMLLDWNGYTHPIHPEETTRRMYNDRARGHFSYIPLNPVNNTGLDFENDWGSLTNLQRSDYYDRCRGYILVGWGNSRMDDRLAKGLSDSYWSNDLGFFDFDNSLSADLLEQRLSDTSNAGLVQPEMVDSDGSSGAYGGTLMGGGPDIDQSFFGAVVFKIAPNG